MRSHFCFVLVILFAGCQVNEKTSIQPSKTTNQAATAKTYFQVNLKVDYVVPTVGISEYTLITDDVEAHRKDAEAIMRIKKDVPLAMQTKEAGLFDRALARNFTFRGFEDGGEFYNREDYIRDRTGGAGKVERADYENLVLQFFGDTAVLTYRNVVKSRDEKGAPQTWRYTWAEVFVKEDGAWKVGALHEIDGRKE